METHLRSIVKGVSWRFIATMVTALVVYVYSGELAAAAIVGSIDAVAKIVLFWGHERIWQQIRWGRVISTVSSP